MIDRGTTGMGKRVDVIATETDDGTNIIVDNRFCVMVPKGIAANVIWLVRLAVELGERGPGARIDYEMSRQADQGTINAALK
jgi:hypothetical protein